MPKTMLPSSLSNKISKRFGADRDRGRGRSGARRRARRSASSGRTGPARRRCSASSAARSRPMPAASSSRAAISRRRRRRGAARLGIGALVSDPAAVRRHERCSRISVVAAAFGGRRRERDAYERLHGDSRALRPRRQGEPPRRQPHAARPQAAGARPRARDRSARAAARRGRGRPDRARMRTRWSSSSRAMRRGGVSIIWIEHVVHALLAGVDRLLVLHGGAFIADGEPQAVIRSPAVAEIYHGDRRPMPDARRCSRCGELDAFYGDFQALFGVSPARSRRGEAVAVIGANGAGKSTLLKRIAGLMRGARRRDRVRWRADRRSCRRTRSRRAASRWCRKGAGCFRR